MACPRTRFTGFGTQLLCLGWWCRFWRSGSANASGEIDQILWVKHRVGIAAVVDIEQEGDGGRFPRPVAEKMRTPFMAVVVSLPAAGVIPVLKILRHHGRALFPGRGEDFERLEVGQVARAVVWRRAATGHKGRDQPFEQPVRARIAVVDDGHQPGQQIAMA